MSLTSNSFNDAAFFWAKTKLLFLRLLSSSARLPGFPIYQMPDYRNFTAINNDNNSNNKKNNDDDDDDNNNNNNAWFLEMCQVSI
jgi:hypothetical protein